LEPSAAATELPMPTTLENVVHRYIRAKNLSIGTLHEYHSTLRKWKTWGGPKRLQSLTRKDVAEFLDWVDGQAVLSDGGNPGRTANKARDNLRAIMSWAGNRS
jgi:hypothetical protein